MCRNGTSNRMLQCMFWFLARSLYALVARIIHRENYPIPSNCIIPYNESAI